MKTNHTKKGKEEEQFILTPMGYFGRKEYDRLCLHMERIGFNAIVLENGNLDWQQVIKRGKDENKQGKVD